MLHRRTWIGYASAVAGALAGTLLGLAMRPRFDLVNVAMVYLLAVVAVAARFERGPAIAAALLSVLAFDLVFVPPQGHFTVDDVQYLLTFAIMVGVAVLISQLVERARLEAAERARAETAADAERIRSTLLAAIPRELRAPLAIMGREPGSIALERRPSSLSAILPNVLERLRARLAAHRVIVDIQPELPSIELDAPLVEQALANLLENCAAHTPAGTIVRVRAERRGDDALVTVEDYADRASAGEREQLVAAFAHGALEGDVEVALGLALARAIVRAHGGHTWLERPPAGGTRFRFTLPVDARSAAATAPAVSAGNI
jgi:two-component system, OmpR family, sensor histidine kinase KdpD